jgi:phosphate starvation-inducible protein PhoH
MSKKKQSAKSLINKQNFDLIEVTPLTDAQQRFFDNYETKKNQILMGSAGAGKTFLAFYKAFEEIIHSKSDYRRIVIVRSAVPTRDIGFLPGTLEEKSQVYEIPYRGICSELFNRGDAYGILTKNGVVDFMLTSYVRGITLDYTIVIVDEFQNLTAHEADSIITRLGKGSKILFCGDTAQTDFSRQGDRDIDKFLSVVKSMDGWFNCNSFSTDDIVRGDIVKAYIKAKELIHKRDQDG